MESRRLDAQHNARQFFNTIDPAPGDELLEKSTYFPSGYL